MFNHLARLPYLTLAMSIFLVVSSQHTTKQQQIISGTVCQNVVAGWMSVEYGLFVPMALAGRYRRPKTEHDAKADHFRNKFLTG